MYAYVRKISPTVKSDLKDNCCAAEEGKMSTNITIKLNTNFETGSVIEQSIMHMANLQPIPYCFYCVRSLP